MTEKIIIILDEKDYERLKKIADEHDKSFSHLSRRIILEGVSEKEKKTMKKLVNELENYRRKITESPGQT